ncbi:hypothetical protein K7X08_025834 [Anisodus acutangulus]|uniref:Uncharacterized protein n=1 Tax=Anisodus acutangulus TaxID=402998 RepID=A0A9Q1QY17_9SOLA|nr:hypothetical protein K7X08_025834 [Anisodus acutangulus]
MEPASGFLASLCNFICFLPYFFGLLILGSIKGAILCSFILLIVTIGNSAIILSLWPLHLFYTYYCLLRTKQFGAALKLVLCICVLVILFLYPLIGFASSVVGGAAYGFLAPMFATFRAVGGGKTNAFFHIIYDGTWDTVKRSITIVRDVRDVCYHSYFSIMDGLLIQEPPGAKYYEIRLFYIPGAVIAGAVGVLVDTVMIIVIATCKFPYMLFKGWSRLFHDCIGAQGPFLETICVPFAGLAILLWPLAVVGALLGSMLSSIFLGAYAGVVVYQEESFWLGLCYIVASLSIYDEYSNDVLDMPEGSCFPRPQYRKKTMSRASSLSRPNSSRKSTNSINAPMLVLKHLELADGFFEDCRNYGEIMVSKDVITLKDIEDAKSNKDCGQVITIGLPAYCILQTLIRSAKANSTGLLLNDNVTEITSTNRPADAFYEWFLNPVLIIKDQIRAEDLSESEEEYLGKLVLLSSDPERLKNSNIGSPPESDLRRAEFDALARRLRGITKSISRYPTFRRRFDGSIKIILEELVKKNGDSRKSEDLEPLNLSRSKSMFARVFGQKSVRNRTNKNEFDQVA